MEFPSRRYGRYIIRSRVGEGGCRCGLRRQKVRHERGKSDESTELQGAASREFAVEYQENLRSIIGLVFQGDSSMY